MASSLYNRLHGIFRASRAGITTKSQLGSGERKLQSLVELFQEPSGTDKDRSIVDAKERKLEKLVVKFKKSSESPRFRQRHDILSATVRRLRAGKKSSMIDEILQYQKKFQDIESEDFVIRLMLMYGYSGMSDHAQKLFDEMPQLKCERTVKAFNALLSAHIHSRKFKVAEEALRELPEKLGLKPDVVSYNTILKSFDTGKRSFEQALSMLDEMEKQGVEPDLITFNTLLQAFYKRGTFAEGEKVWTLMESKNVAPDIRSYNSRLRGLVYSDRVQEAVELMGEMGRKGIEPDVHSYNALLAGYNKEENLDEAMKVYKELKEKNHKPDQVTYCLLIPLLCEKGDLDTTQEICKEAATNRKLLRPGMLKPVIDALVKDSRVEEAKNFVKSAKLEKYFRYDKSLFG